MDMLLVYKLIDSFYSIALCSQIYHITHQIPAVQCVRAWRVWELMGFKHLQNMVCPAISIWSLFL